MKIQTDHFPREPLSFSRIIMHGTVLVCMLIITALPASCATVGRDFPSDKVSQIKVHETTRDEILTMFGSPWREGIDSGQKTWTYGIYRYMLLGDTETRDLVVRFDDKGIVSSYTFNSTGNPE